MMHRHHIDVYRQLRQAGDLRRFLDAGMTVTGGTDWGPKSVFEHIQLTLTHRMPSGPSVRLNQPGQAVSMWTRVQLLQWQGIGCLSPGAHADLVDRDLIGCEIEEIANVRVLRTLFDGTSSMMRACFSRSALRHSRPVASPLSLQGRKFRIGHGFDRFPTCAMFRTWK
jgi:hypothetical protein